MRREYTHCFRLQLERQSRWLLLHATPHAATLSVMTPTYTSTVVIRALNEAAHIGRLLAGIASQDHQPDEVVLVDSGSTDGTVEIAEKFGCEVIHMPPSEFTFGRALNWGCAAAKGDLLIFVSAHVYPLDPSWLGSLVAPFETPQVGLTYGGQTGDSRSNFAELRLLDRWFPSEPDLDQDEPFCNNANCAIRRSLWEENQYDEDLAGLEDIAFARQIKSDGHRVAYVPSARIAHVHEEGFRQTMNRYRREAIAYKAIFGRSEMSLVQAVALGLTSIVSDAAAAVRSRQPEVIMPATSFRIAQFAGAYQGHRSDAAESRQIVRRMYYPRG